MLKKRRPARARCALTGKAASLAVIGLAVAGAAASASTAGTWGFEQVTPVEKGSGMLSGTTAGFIATPDGRGLLHSSYLPYESLPVESSPAQSRYLATRNADGWLNDALDPPYLLPHQAASTAQFLQAVVGVSQNLDYVLVASRQPLAPGADPSGGGLYLKSTRTGRVSLIFTTPSELVMARLLGGGGGVNYVLSVANDGKSVLFVLSDAALVPGAPGSGLVLYSWSEGAGVRYEAVVGGIMVNNLNIPGASNIGPRDSMPFDDRALDHVYFQTGTNVNTGPVYVREGPPDARVTRLVTYSRIAAQPAPPTGGVPLAVSGGAKHLLFRTGNNVPLAGGEPALPTAGRHLYRFNAEAQTPADELTYIGAVPAATRILQMSQDGKTIAFYSTIAQAGSPAGSQQKLFVWREGVGTKYVYTADAGSTGTSTQDQLRRLSDSGRYLAFTDNSVSLAAQFGGFVNVSAGCPNILGMPGPCDMVYRYDTETGELDCASCRTDGQAPLGASGEPSRRGAGLLELGGHLPRIAANDGRVFFTSRDGLLREDRNALDDVYEWTEGAGLRLLSPATPGKRARFVDASSSGDVVFLASRARLASSDRDDEDDIYATFAGAGMGGGVAPPIVAPCSGGDCRNPFVAPPAPSEPGTVSPGGSGDVKPARERTAVRVHWARVRRGRLQVRVRASGAGRIRVTGGTIRSATREVSKGGVYTVKARLTTRSARRLRDRGRLSVRVRASLSPPFGKSARKNYRRTVRK